MVRLNRGGRGRGGRPTLRPPLMPRPNMPVRPMPPFPRPPMMRGAPRGRLLRPSAPHHLGPPPPPLSGPPHHPRLFRPPPPQPPHLPPPPPLHHPLPPPHHHPLPPPHHHPLPPPHHHPPPPPHHPLNSGRQLPLPPHPRHLPPGLPPPQPLPFPRPPLRGKFRGGLRGQRGVKRLGAAANGRAKKIHKRKEKTEEMELNKPWITEALKTEIHKKFELYKSAKEKKTDDDWLAYKEQRILVGKMTSAAKLEYIGSHPEADVDKIMAEVQSKE